MCLTRQFSASSYSLTLSLTLSSIRIYFSSLNVAFSTTASPTLRRGCGEGAGVYPSSFGVKAGSQPGQAASSSQGLRGRQTTICVRSYGQLAVPSSPHVHVFRLWRDLGYPMRTRSVTGRTSKLHTFPRTEPLTILLAKKKSHIILIIRIFVVSNLTPMEQPRIIRQPPAQMLCLSFRM